MKRRKKIPMPVSARRSAIRRMLIKNNIRFLVPPVPPVPPEPRFVAPGPFSAVSV